MNDYRFDAFMAYSHQADGLLAQELHRLLLRVDGRPFSPEPLRIFRAEAALTLTSSVWDSLGAAIANSASFVLLASRHAAMSHWVGHEVEFWLQHRELSRFFIVVTDGDIAWNAGDGDFDWASTTALPPNLKGRFWEEPRFLDLRWIDRNIPLDSDGEMLTDAVLTLGATLYGIDKDQLDVEGRRARLFRVPRSALQHELRRREAQLREQTAQLQQLQYKVREQTLRIRELAAFEEQSASSGGVFISYSHSDRDVVDKLTNRFQIDNVNYWRDDKDLQVGDIIDKAISRGIQENVLFLVVLTPTSIESRWVERELDEAAHEEVEGRKVVLPVVAKNLDAERIPPRLRKKLYVDISGRNFNTGYEKLLRSIHRHLEVSGQVDDP
jgi:hypothetical protein